jgi:hypothetical protein
MWGTPGGDYSSRHLKMLKPATTPPGRRRPVARSAIVRQFLSNVTRDIEGRRRDRRDIYEVLRDVLRFVGRRSAEGLLTRS